MAISVNALKRVGEFGRELDRDAELPDVEMIGGMYPRGYLSVLAAQAGTGKTWFMQYMSCRLSCGGNILAGLVMKSRKMKIVIFAGETGKFLLDKRLQATCWAYDKKRIKVYDALELQREEIPVMLNTDEGKTTFLAILEAEKPDLVFFDTLISFHTADESKQAEMTNIITFLLRTASVFNCAIVLNHHIRKRSTKILAQKFIPGLDDIIGSGVIGRLASCAYVAYQAPDPTGEREGMPTVIVSNPKSWLKKTPDFAYQFVDDEASGLLDFAIDWSYTSANNGEWSLRERVNNLVNDHEAGAMITLEEAASSLVASKDSVRKYLDDHVKKGTLERRKLITGTVWVKK